VFDQTASRLHEPLLQTRQRPVIDPLRQHQPLPQFRTESGCWRRGALRW
jgi:hypothetical protein